MTLLVDGSSTCAYPLPTFAISVAPIAFRTDFASSRGARPIYHPMRSYVGLRRSPVWDCGRSVSQAESRPSGLSFRNCATRCRPRTGLSRRVSRLPRYSMRVRMTYSLRDAVLLSLRYDADLRVSELVAVDEPHIDPQEDSSATLFIPTSKTDQDKIGAWAWLSPETMRRVGAWLQASGIHDGPIFRRVGVDRRRARCEDEATQIARVTYTIGTASLTRQGVNGIYRRVARWKVTAIASFSPSQWT